MKVQTLSPSTERNPVRALVHRPGFKLALLVVLHPSLALVMRESSSFATAHAVFIVLLGLWFALFGKDLRRVSYVAAYIAGAEVLWRMTDARIFWEAGKYATILILGVSLLRLKHWQRVQLPVLYFFLLCLSIPLTVSGLGVTSDARETISFNMSGPLALAVAALYFSQLQGDAAFLRRLLWCILLPIFGIASLTLSGMLSAGSIAFTMESNFATSGGFGPNQVSAALGLGGGLLLLLSFSGSGFRQRSTALILGVGFIALSTLTFSRGGLYNAAFMLILALLHSLRDPRQRFLTVFTLLILGSVGGYLIFPRLNTFTGGMLGERFSDLETTRRAQLAQTDLNLWLQHPLLGVGPGMAKMDRFDVFGIAAAAHTEYTRLLAEHGTAGLLALVVLIVMAARAYFRSPTREIQYWTAALLAWPVMEMSHAAMRIVAISFLFGLAMMNWNVVQHSPQEANRE